MDAIKTVDMVGAPSGNKTGQARSQADISSCCDMKRRRVAEDAILNSVDDCTGQEKFSEMLENKYKNAEYCGLCFRLFCARPPQQTKSHIWETQWCEEDGKHILIFIEERWQKPFYQEVIKSFVTPDSRVKVCKHCSEFMRKGMRRIMLPNEPNHMKPILPMHVAIKYILSGGCSQRPCYKMLMHCIESLCYRFMRNPIMHYESMFSELWGLADKIQIIAKQWDVFYHDNDDAMDMSKDNVAANKNEVYVGMARWLTEGSQHFLTDAIFAKKMRRILDKNEKVQKWWTDRIPPHIACRHHYSVTPGIYRALVQESVGKYEDKLTVPASMVLVHGCLTPQMETKKMLNKIEDERFLIDNVSCFCMLCNRTSVISYEYTVMLKNAAGGEAVQAHRDAYYDQMARRARKQRLEWTRLL